MINCLYDLVLRNSPACSKLLALRSCNDLQTMDSYTTIFLKYQMYLSECISQTTQEATSKLSGLLIASCTKVLQRPANQGLLCCTSPLQYFPNLVKHTYLSRPSECNSQTAQEAKSNSLACSKLQVLQ